MRRFSVERQIDRCGNRFSCYVQRAIVGHFRIHFAILTDDVAVDEIRGVQVHGIDCRRNVVGVGVFGYGRDGKRFAFSGYDGALVVGHGDDPQGLDSTVEARLSRNGEFCSKFPVDDFSAGLRQYFSTVGQMLGAAIINGQIVFLRIEKRDGCVAVEFSVDAFYGGDMPF